MYLGKITEIFLVNRMRLSHRVVDELIFASVSSKALLGLTVSPVQCYEVGKNIPTF